MKKLILAIPGWLLCGLIWSLPIENTHYRFENPGMNTNSITIIAFLSVIAIGYALIALFFKHKNKNDFVLQYLTLFLVVIRLIQIIFVFLLYYL